MDKKELKEIEKEIKVYDSSYKTKVVKPGSVIEVFMEDSKQMKGSYFYVCKKGEKGAPANLDLTSCIMYDGYLKYFKDAIIDSQIDAGESIFSINEIYETVDDYISRFDDKNIIDVGSVVDVTQDGHNFIYYIVKPDDNVKIQDGLFVINTNAPVYLNLKGKKMGDTVSFDVLSNNNNIVINHVYSSINDYNKRNDINIIKPGSVVDANLDGIPFILYLSNDIIDSNDYETVSLNSNLFKTLDGKATGNSFVYKVKNNNINGYINKVYDSLEDYLNITDTKEKTMS